MLKFWWKILKSLKTPIWIPLDRKYELTTKDRLTTYYTLMPDMKYTADVSDCDNFALVYVGIAARFTNAVGLVFGWHKGFHSWNCAILDDKIVQVEPQTGEVFTRKKGYRPLVVII